MVEAARMLGMSSTTLERWASDGRITSEVTGAGVRVFRRGDLLDRWVTVRTRHRRHD